MFLKPYIVRIFKSMLHTHIDSFANNSSSFHIRYTKFSNIYYFSYTTYILFVSEYNSKRYTLTLIRLLNFLIPVIIQHVIPNLVLFITNCTSFVFQLYRLAIIPIINLNIPFLPKTVLFQKFWYDWYA